MSKINLKKLREMASAATQNWSARERNAGSIMHEFEIVQAGGSILMRTTSYGNMEEDAQYVGALCPSNLLALLDYIEKANAALVFYGDKRNWVLKRTITASGGVRERISERGKLARAALAGWKERFE